MSNGMFFVFIIVGTFALGFLAFLPIIISVLLDIEMPAIVFQIWMALVGLVVFIYLIYLIFSMAKKR